MSIYHQTFVEAVGFIKQSNPKLDTSEAKDIAFIDEMLQKKI